MQKREFDGRWLRLAEAAADTRDSLRRMAPRLDGALLDDAVSGNLRILLEDVRAIAGRHAMLLTLSLKDPAGDRAQNARSRAAASPVPSIRAWRGEDTGRPPEGATGAETEGRECCKNAKGQLSEHTNSFQV